VAIAYEAGMAAMGHYRKRQHSERRVKPDRGKLAKSYRVRALAIPPGLPHLLHDRQPLRSFP